MKSLTNFTSSLSHPHISAIFACHACQQSKVYHHVTAPLQLLSAPATRFNSIQIDVLGLLPLTKGYTYLFPCIDKYTCWPEAIPMTDATAESCVQAVLSNWVYHFRVPLMIIFDQRLQFQSGIWRQLVYLLETTHHRTIAYQANGLVECFH